MKKDTSNQLLIDLDLHFQAKKPSSRKSEVIDLNQPKVDFNDIVSEWSYKLPKGYPTMVDGVFTEPNEIAILNKILKEYNLPQLELNESRVFVHTDWSYIPNDRHVSEFESFGFEENKLKEQPFNHINRESSDWPIEGVDLDFYLVKGSSKIRQINYSEFEITINQKNTVLLRSEAYPNKYLVVQGDVNALTAAKGALASDTEVKEGMVVLFYYAQDIQTAPEQNNLNTIITSLKDTLENTPSSAISELTKRKLSKYLEAVNTAKPTAAVKALKDPYSSALMVLSKYSSDGWDMIRTDLFDRVRVLGSKLTKLMPDKWCPGDVYLVNKSKLAEVESQLSQLEKNMPDDGIALLNSMFVDTWGGQDNPLVAISLKAEKAQAGKAKQYLQLLSKKDATYNISKEESELSVEEVVSQVQKHRSEIAALVKEASINIILDQDSNAASMDEKRLREKFASLKLTSYLLGDRGEDIDENLLGAVAFGMSLSGVNPTFWKIVGNTSGQAKIIENPAGSTIGLLYGGLDSNESTITIRDKDSNNAVRFEMFVEKQGHKHLVWLNARSNGRTQATLEIVKDQPT